MPKDKLYHFIAGAIIGLFGLVGPLVGIMAVLTAALVKEARDLSWRRLRKWFPLGPYWLIRQGWFEIWDILATVGGGVVTILAIETWRQL